MYGCINRFENDRDKAEPKQTDDPILSCCRHCRQKVVHVSSKEPTSSVDKQGWNNHRGLNIFS